MSSILTNNSAMIALDTLRNVNGNLNDVRSQISTGKEVNSAKDNAAVFAISQVMESDVAGFEAVSDSLSLGQSTLAVASNAAESVGDLLNEIKGKIVSANEDNVDRNQLQSEIVSLRDQVISVTSAAQFNGLNLVDGSTSSFSVLASLDRDSSGNVTTSSVDVSTSTTNLSATAGVDLLAGGAAASDVGASATLDESGGADDEVVINGFAFQGGGAALASTDGAGGADPTVDTGLLAGDLVSISIGNTRGTYTVREGDTGNEVAAGIRTALADAGVDQGEFDLDGSTAGALTITNNGSGTADFAIEVSRGSGGLSGLQSIDVSSAGGAASALTDIEAMIQTTVNAQAELGTGEARLEIQSDFMSSLVDNFNSGIGSLVDTNMEEASARLQALQVQQQLATQSLSMANQAPQSIMSLFR